MLVQNGTPNFGQPSLCGTCRNAQNIKGPQFNDDVTFCRVHGNDPIKITRPVLSCSEYDDKRVPSVWQMEKIAWRFSADMRRNSAGFISADTFRKQLKSEGKEEDDLILPF